MQARASIHGEKSVGTKARSRPDQTRTTLRYVGDGSHCLEASTRHAWRAKRTRTNDASECNGQEEDDKRQATTASEREWRRRTPAAGAPTKGERFTYARPSAAPAHSATTVPTTDARTPSPGGTLVCQARSIPELAQSWVWNW